MIKRISLIIGTLVIAVVCSCGPTPGPDGPIPVGGDGGTADVGPVVTRETLEDFREAVVAFLDLQRTGSVWTREQCERLADQFEEVSEESDNGLAEAIYNRGVAYQQCGMHDEAKAAFQQALQMRADYPAAMIQLGVYEMLAQNVSQAEELFNRAFGIDIAAYQAYLNLGIIAAARGCFRPGQSSAGPCQMPADLQIGNALAIESESVIALENLARFYFDYSNQADANSRFRRFALLIVNYAISKNRRYAPVYNLRGLIFLKDGNIRAAIGDFDQARRADADFYEAHINYASLNLGFRGYRQACEAYTAALRIRPDSYDALIGVGVSIRGLASEGEYAVAEMPCGGVAAGTPFTYDMALERYEAARALDENRPEAYINTALLYHGFLNDGTIEQCERAVASYGTAIQRAQSFQGDPGTGIDYRELLALGQAKKERAERDCETIRQLALMEAQALEVERQMQQEEERIRLEEERLRQEQEAAGGGAEGGGAEGGGGEGGGAEGGGAEGGGGETPPAEGDEAVTATPEEG